MEFGIFHEFPSLPGRSDADAFAEAFGIVHGTEHWRLDAIWLAELHFGPERSVLTSPKCIASAIDARTQRIKIGVAVQCCCCAIRCVSRRKPRQWIRSAGGG